MADPLPGVGAGGKRCHPWAGAGAKENLGAPSPCSKWAVGAWAAGAELGWLHLGRGGAQGAAARCHRIPQNRGAGPQGDPEPSPGQAAAVCRSARRGLSIPVFLTLETSPSPVAWGGPGGYGGLCGAFGSWRRAAHAGGGSFFPDTSRSGSIRRHRAAATACPRLELPTATVSTAATGGRGRGQGCHQAWERGGGAVAGAGCPPRGTQTARRPLQGLFSPFAPPARCTQRLPGAPRTGGDGVGATPPPPPGCCSPAVALGGCGSTGGCSPAPAGCCGSAPRQPCGKSCRSPAAAARQRGGPQPPTNPTQGGSAPWGGTHASL